MAVSNLTFVSTSTMSFNDWINITNNLVNYMANSAVTANSTLGVTSGNAYVNGIFSANTLVATQGLRGGNNSTANTIALPNGFTSNVATFIANQVSLATASAGQTIDTFTTSTYRTCRYIVQVTTSNGYDSRDIMLMHDGTSTYLTEYAVLQSNGSMGTWAASIAAGSVTLAFSPTQSTSTVNFQRVSIGV